MAKRIENRRLAELLATGGADEEMADLLEELKAVPEPMDQAAAMSFVRAAYLRGYRNGAVIALEERA